MIRRESEFQHVDMVAAEHNYKTGRLTARPGAVPESGKKSTGVQPLPVHEQKAGLLYVPQQYDPGKPAALAVMLHGAGAPAAQGLSLLRSYADESNMILVAPAATAYSWDIIASRKFGPDIAILEEALHAVFENYAINPERIAIGGFSDGASYALSVGLTNGDLFTHIIAFSPGFVHTPENRGKPKVYLSHGIHDPVLPIDPCGRRIVPQLKRLGLEVNYKEFDGRHELPADIAKAAVTWFMS